MNDASLSRRLATLIAGEMAASLAAGPRHEVALEPVDPEAGPGLRLSFKVTGTQIGSVVVWFPASTGANAKVTTSSPDASRYSGSITNSHVMPKSSWAGSATVRRDSTKSLPSMSI